MAIPGPSVSDGQVGRGWILQLGTLSGVLVVDLTACKVCRRELRRTLGEVPVEGEGGQACNQSRQSPQIGRIASCLRARNHPKAGEKWLLESRPEIRDLALQHIWGRSRETRCKGRSIHRPLWLLNKMDRETEARSAGGSQR